MNMIFFSTDDIFLKNFVLFIELKKIIDECRILFKGDTLEEIYAIRNSRWTV